MARLARRATGPGVRKGRRETRRPFDRLALAGAMDAKTPWFRSQDTRCGGASANDGGRAEARPLGDMLPAGATDAGITSHFGSRGEMGTGLATRPLVRSAGGGDGCQRHAPSRQSVTPWITPPCSRISDREGDEARPLLGFDSHQHGAAAARPRVVDRAADVGG